MSCDGKELKAKVKATDFIFAGHTWLEDDK
jgi:hypothetical protein